MDTVRHPESLPARDEHGLLLHPDDWNETVAQQLAQQLGLKELSQDHWLVIYALRDYYNKFGVAPAMMNICRSFARDRFWVHDLFDSCLNAWRISGLPDPGEEAKAYLNDM